MSPQAKRKRKPGLAAQRAAAIVEEIKDAFDDLHSIKSKTRREAALAEIIEYVELHMHDF